MPPEEPPALVAREFALRPDVAPANGPEWAQGTVTLNHTAEGVLLEVGTIAVDGLPAGTYDAWIVFGDALVEEGLFSQLAAQLTVTEDLEHVESVLMLGTLIGREFSLLKQIVISPYRDIGAEVGGEPVAGGAGLEGWIGSEIAQLAAYVEDVPVPDVQEPPVEASEPQQPAISRSFKGRAVLPAQRGRLRRRITR
jgi:hypothetical protein